MLCAVWHITSNCLVAHSVPQWHTSENRAQLIASSMPSSSTGHDHTPSAGEKKKRQTLNYLLRFPTSEILLGWGEGVRIEPTRLSASLCFRLAHLLCNLDGLFPPFSLHFRSPVSLPFSYPISHTISVLQLRRFILSRRGMLFRN